MGDELLADTREVRRAEVEEAAWWSTVMDDFEEGLQEVLEEAARSPLPAQELDAGLSTARRGIKQASLTTQQVPRLLEDDIKGGLHRLGELALATEAALFTLALEAHGRGLPGETGFGWSTGWRSAARGCPAASSATWTPSLGPPGTG